ncbi:hypothetical protein FOA52_014062 [Chlamydomonas sp. UWO 241]|nr:hypothetical protein FOA52_014062 [Chlamydomonas sp. UWO 241]
MELFGPSPHDCRRLTARLKAAKSWRDLAALLPSAAAEWAGVDTICLSAGFVALARVAPRERVSGGGRSGDGGAAGADVAAVLRTLVALARPRLAEFDAQGLVSTAVSIAKLQEYCGPEYDAPSVAPAPSIASTSGSSASSSGSASAAQASPQQQQQQPPPLGSSSHPGVSARCASAVAAGSAGFGGQGPLSLLPPLLACSTYVMGSFSPQALANLVWALATVGLHPSGAWLTDYYRRTDESVDALKSQDVANIMWSLCKLDLMPDIWLRDSLVQRSLEAVREQDGSSGQDPATLVQCLARWYYLYNYRPSDEWLAEYLRIVQPSLATYMPFDLVSIVHSCVVMNYLPQRSWMADYYTTIMHALKHDPTLSYNDFQRLMWALSRIDYTPPLTWQREFVAVSVPKLRHLKIRALSELVWALAVWGARPSPEWLAAFFNASGPRLRDARPEHISCQLSALAKLEVRAPGPWLDQALGSFCAQLADAKAHDLVTLLDTITSVCGHDADWLQSKTATIKALADTAASKFHVYDAVMHTKLVLALAAANVCPAAEWLAKQQAALLQALRAETLLSTGSAHGESGGGGGGARGGSVAQRVQRGLLREAYSTWDVEVDAELRPFL